MNPFLSGLTVMIFHPQFSIAFAISRIAGCSIALRITLPWFGRVRMERRGMWSLSVPPDVKKIVDNLKKVKTLKSNDPVFAPDDETIILANSKAIFVKGKVQSA